MLGALLSAGAALPAENPIEVVASRTGFRPATLELRKGEAAHLALSTADEEHCFAVDAFRIEKRIVPGKVTSLELTPDRTGSFPFYCCLEPRNPALRGTLVVSE